MINYDLNGGPNRWATERRPREVPISDLGGDWLELDLKEPTKFNEVRLHFCRSRWGMGAPASLDLEIKVGDDWQPIGNQRRTPEKPTDETINVIHFDDVESRYLRLVVKHSEGKPVCALSEIELLNRVER